jgi:hypothetical protein
MNPSSCQRCGLGGVPLIPCREDAARARSCLCLVCYERWRRDNAPEPPDPACPPWLYRLFSRGGPVPVLSFPFKAPD